MTLQVLIAGGGPGGLAAAVAARRAGWEARVLEQAQALSEVGAGIQLGPNAMRILREWGLLDAGLRDQLAFPAQVEVRDAGAGAVLARLPLGRGFEARYGAPYATVHRADLQAALLGAAVAAGARVQTGSRVVATQDADGAVAVLLADGRQLEADALLGADGLWSAVRAQLADPRGPRATGHLAYRGLVRMDDLPPALRSRHVTAWLGPRMHLVHYPIRAGEWLNVVCFVEGRIAADARGWDHAGLGGDLQEAVGPVAGGVRDLLAQVPQWRLWALHDRAPLRGPQEMARGGVALLGDAAHPMLPYLAQGAGMALEDARELQRVLAGAASRAVDVPTALQRYALNRWQRCARVQARSQRNARIFHADGLLRWGRNGSLRLLGERLLDMPWLYGA